MPIQWTGRPTQGENQSFLEKLNAALAAHGVTRVNVTSGYRSPEHNAAVGGATHSNHMAGKALDGTAFVPGKGWVPLGTLLLGDASKFGLRSGATFDWGGKPDTVHVDDASNVGGVKGQPTSLAPTIMATVPAMTPIGTPIPKPVPPVPTPPPDNTAAILQALLAHHSQSAPALVAPQLTHLPARAPVGQAAVARLAAPRAVSLLA